MSTPSSHEELCTRFNAGEEFDFLHFWGHTAPANGGLSKSCFSQWFMAPFEVDGACYLSAEHFMMASKARLFDDHESAARILASPSPDDAKRLGRRVRGFDDAVWLAHRYDIVVRASVEKFRQVPGLRGFLLGTGTKVLVEASPLDNIWGIGMAATDPRANDPNAWNGPNLLGFALIEARRILQAST